MEVGVVSIISGLVKLLLALVVLLALALVVRLTSLDLNITLGLLALALVVGLGVAGLHSSYQGGCTNGAASLILVSQSIFSWGNG